MKFTLNSAHPLTKYYRTVPGMTELQINEYYLKEYDGKIIEFTGNILNISDRLITINVLLDLPTYQGQVNVFFMISGTSAKDLLKYNINELVSISGRVTSMSSFNVNCDFISIVKFSGLSDEEKEKIEKSEDKNFWLVRGVVFLLISVVLLPFDGYVFVLGIFTGLITLLCFVLADSN